MLLDIILGGNKCVFVLNIEEEVIIYEGKAVKVKEWQYIGPSGEVRARTCMVTR
jgi:hypothetical protein